MKQTRTEINLTIPTDYTHTDGDLLESVRQRIEVTSFHLQSLFSFIKRSAREVEGAIRDEESQSVSGFCYDLMNFADLGEGLALSIWAATSDLTELQTTQDATTKAIDTDDEDPDPILEHTAHPKTLANVISALITNPNVPMEISEALQDAVNEIMNASKQTEVLEYEKSAEYIAKVLRDYRSE